MSFLLKQFFSEQNLQLMHKQINYILISIILNPNPKSNFFY